jgi:hypothetical protein
MHAQCPLPQKLPALYVLDSILKNVGDEVCDGEPYMYKSLFAQNLAQVRMVPCSDLAFEVGAQFACLCSAYVCDKGCKCMLSPLCSVGLCALGTLPVHVYVVWYPYYFPSLSMQQVNILSLVRCTGLRQRLGCGATGPA